MSIPTVNVLVTVHEQDGSPAVGAQVIAKLMTTERYNGFVVPDEYSGVTNSDGNCTIALFPNELGTEGSEYKFKIIHRNGKTINVFASIPNYDCSLHQVSELDRYELRGAGNIIVSEVLGYANDAIMARDNARAAELSAVNYSLVAQGHKVDAEVAANTATTKASEANTSAVNAQASEAAAAASQTGAATSAANANTAKVAAEAARDLANSHKADAQTARDKAQSWAEQNENVVVETGKYSAKHHAAKAAASATAASTSKDTATAKASEAAASATTALGYANEAKGYRDTAATHASDALANKNAAAVSAGNASTSAATATTKASEAATSASQALTYKGQCENFYNGMVAEGLHSHNNKAVLDATTASYTVAERDKLSGIAINANNYTHPATHPATMIVQDSSNRLVTDTEKATWNGKASTAVATTSANGLMSSTDKTKLDGVASNANNYTHPASHPAAMITDDSTHRFVTDTEKAGWNAKASTAVATTSVDGLMSAGDKGKLDGIATGANNYVHPTSDGNKHVPATGTTNNGKVLKAGSTDGSASWQSLSKSDVGLSDVDNTADSAKPVSTAMQTALDGKANVSHTHTSANISDATHLATGDTVVKRDSSGDATFRYTTATYHSMSHSVASRSTDTVFYSSTDNYIRKNTLAGFKASLGLNNVDNTRDVDKPVSTAVQTAIDASIVTSRNKNKIINGNFDIWQRGTSQTSSEYGSVDRWASGRVGSNNKISRQAFVLGQSDVPNNPVFFVRNTVTSVAGANNYALLKQKIENVSTFSGKRVTISFWAKADTNRNIAVELEQSFGSGGSPSASVSGIGKQLVALTNVWQKFTVTFDVPSISGKTLGTDGNDCLIPHFWFDAGSAYAARSANLGHQSGTFDIAQVQLEEGEVATAFEQRHIADELALCQRYYNQSPTNGGADRLIFSGDITSGSNYTGFIRFPVYMRTVPIITLAHVTTSGFPTTSGTRQASVFGIQEGRLANATVSGGSYTSTYTADAEL